MIPSASAEDIVTKVWAEKLHRVAPIATPSVISYRDVPLLVQFKVWLMSLQRGKNLAAAKQHVSQVLAIWQATDFGQNSELISIINPSNVSTYWVEPNRELLQPGTLRSHLGS